MANYPSRCMRGATPIAKMAGGCHMTMALDDGLTRILKLLDLAPLRELLATKPVVSGKRL